METIIAHNVNIVGSGEQHIMLAHGFGTDQSVWRYLVPHLLDDYRVVLFDQMGAGSTNPDHYDFRRTPPLTAMLLTYWLSWKHYKLNPAFMLLTLFLLLLVLLLPFIALISSPSLSCSVLPRGKEETFSIFGTLVYT